MLNLVLPLLAVLDLRQLGYSKVLDSMSLRDYLPNFGEVRLRLGIGLDEPGESDPSVERA